jgi:two-component system OmpR family sensor kinase
MRRSSLPSFLPLPLSSLRARLALWYLLMLGTVLLFLGAVVFWEVRGSLYQGVAGMLEARAAAVSGQVGVGATGPHYQGRDVPLEEAETAVYLFGAHGRLRDQIAGAAELPPRPGILAAALRGSQGGVTVKESRYYMIPVLDRQERVAGAIQVVTSLDTVNDQVNKLLALLLLAAPALLAVATAGGVFLAGRALAPIDRITRTARAIEAGNLAGRLGLAPRDDEVGRLAATFDGMLDRLERAFIQQERAGARQRQFAADASHELRTPLTIIKGDLDVLLRRQRSAEEYEEVVRDVDEEVTRLGGLVEDLLTLARADSGQAELTREFVYLDALVDETAAGVRRLAEAKGVSVETRLAPDIAVVGDPVRLRQLVVNLLGNAVKYTPAGGRVRVTLGAVAAQARLDVADSGIGIAPEDLPHVFDRFFRADKARARAEGGTGLGLAIARWCAETHGGRIDVRSRPGEGSVFTVWLPLVLADDDGADHPSHDGAATAAKREPTTRRVRAT